MILTLIGVGSLVVGIISIHVNSRLYRCDWKDYLTTSIGVIGIPVGVVVSMICVGLIISSHITVDKDIHDRKTD